jgi:hypothetical protein
MNKTNFLISYSLYTKLPMWAMTLALSIFLITNCKKEDKIILTIPVVLTSEEIGMITSASAQCGGQVVSDGGSKITARGICWDTIANPTILKSSKISDKDTFVCSLTGLRPKYAYHVRAFATNSIGTAYGEEVVFTTALFSLPILSTHEVTGISETIATAGGSISSDGNAYISKRGVCWNTSSSPTVDGNKTIDGNSSGEFTSNLTGLTGNTVYYLRAYATNAAGTAYGNEISFTTQVTALPKITTVAVSNIASGHATCGGTIEPGTSIANRGVCWGTKHLPTLADNKTSDGLETGSFTSSLTLLASRTVYYVRSYATNSAGTAYGNEVSFTSAASGNVTYTLVKEASPTAEQLNAYQLIKIAMDSALYYYNSYTTFTKNISVNYVPGVATADGSNNGTIRFGSNTYYMNAGTAMHEIAHTLGVGTNSSWSSLMVGGIYTGSYATDMLRSLTGDQTAQIHGDTQHFWPYGINYPTEITSASVLVYHCKILEAMKKDGL